MNKLGFILPYAAQVGAGEYRMATFGYARQPAEGTRNLRTEIAAQENVIREYCCAKIFSLGETIADGAGAAGLPLFSRPGGGRLAARLRPGDRLIVADACWAFAGPADFRGR